MPTLQKQNKTPGRRGAHSRDDINKMQGPAIPRDDLKGAFAGKENNGATGTKGEKHSTHLKSRNTKKSKGKIPKM